MSKEDQINSECDKLKLENDKLKENLGEVLSIKKRMENIIEICELNSHQNEKWIIGLNKLFANYDKMIQYEKENLESIKNECKDVEKLQNEYLQQFNELIHNRRDYADYINTSLENQKYISSQIKNSTPLSQISRLSDS
jgi:molybdopterin converting factor small subunit